MQINKHGSFYIRNGWPTKIIDAITSNPYIFSPNCELQAVDEIGVGRVMIKAMRYWSAVLGLSVETKTPQGVMHSLTYLGNLIYKYDPYCQDFGTLWLLHRMLAKNYENATAWAWAFNDNTQRTFNKESFSNGFYSFLQTNGEKYARPAVEKEFDCFKNTYVSEKSFDIDKIIEEDTIPFFAPLRLITFIGNGTFEMVKKSSKDIEPLIALFCIVSDNDTYLQSGRQISIDSLVEDKGQIGKYMNISYTTILDILQQLDNDKLLSLVNNFGNRYIQLNDIDAEQLLLDYYQNIVR